MGLWGCSPSSYDLKNIEQPLYRCKRLFYIHKAVEILLAHKILDIEHKLLTGCYYHFLR